MLYSRDVFFVGRGVLSAGWHWNQKMSASVASLTLFVDLYFPLMISSSRA